LVDLKLIKFAFTAVIYTLQTIQRRKANWIARILRRNCLTKQIVSGEVEGRIKMIGIRGSRSKQLLDSLKETREYWKLKEEALDRSMWRTGFVRGYRPVVRKKERKKERKTERKKEK
jgi:hypothetical protein